MVAILEVVNKYVAYLRTSTKEQDLGIKGQKEKIDTFVKIKSGSVTLLSKARNSAEYASNILLNCSLFKESIAA